MVWVGVVGLGKSGTLICTARKPGSPEALLVPALHDIILDEPLRGLCRASARGRKDMCEILS